MITLEQLFKLIQPLTTRLTRLEDSHRRHKHTGIETAKMNEGVRDVLMSFETDEQTETKLHFDCAVRITKLRGVVMKAIADTDDGTIQGAKSSATNISTNLPSASGGSESIQFSVANNSTASNTRIRIMGFSYQR